MDQSLPHSRIEKDALGTCELPDGALYGIHAFRGSVNFAVSGRLLGDEPDLLSALVQVKKAAALANGELGALGRREMQALVGACDEILAGKHLRNFIIDLFEGSGGTSLNMNVNEVLANRALELMGQKPGSYDLVHPNDHVNLGQSTNDVMPTALKLAAYAASGPTLDSLTTLADSLDNKRRQFSDVLRLGRTCLQDAQPMMLGQAFGGYAAAVRRSHDHLSELRKQLLEVPLGGTAIGTGLGARPGYRQCVLKHLSLLVGAEVKAPQDPFDAMQNLDEAARLSAELRTAANILWKIANDLILLSSGPDGGIGEIVLPALQAGSSIMPGKINPVLPMMVCQVAFVIAGNDAAIAQATQQGQLEINHFEPMVGVKLQESLRLLEATANLFALRCIDGIEANVERSLAHLLASSAPATALVPRLGYASVSDLVRRASAAGRPFLELAEAEGHIDRQQALDLLRNCSEGRMDV
ncbi:MAG: aspartate ammonia-lyase [Rhodospirillales bacterium]|nr:aspartate ammonia-lyase [Rhodospirillales bacterium]